MMRVVDNKKNREMTQDDEICVITLYNGDRMRDDQLIVGVYITPIISMGGGV
jgi:hypothetical protein